MGILMVGINIHRTEVRGFGWCGGWDADTAVDGCRADLSPRGGLALVSGSPVLQHGDITTLTRT